MPKERVCANGETVSEIVVPVSDYENSKVKGEALCCDRVLEEKRRKVSVLREQQASFLAALPVDPKDAVDASLAVIWPDFGNYIEGFEEALHLSQALAVLIEKGDCDEVPREQEAAEFLSRQVTEHLGRTRKQLDYLSYVLRNPGRVERENKPIA